jgi:hypothetical protein
VKHRDEFERTSQVNDDDLYASPRTPAYKDGSAKFIRIAVFGVLALAVGGAIAYDRMSSPPAAAEAPVEQREQVAFNAPSQAPLPIPEAVPADEPAPAAAKPAPKAPAPVPAPLAEEQSQPVDVDPTTPEVLSPIPEVPADGAP